jgi:uncharacterized protein (DUF488 family)
MEKLYTIGFTEKSARAFFDALEAVGVRTLIDIRLSNTSQLAGFAKKDDLEYFLGRIGGIAYVHALEFAPSPEIFEAYKKRKGSWEDFAAAYAALLETRKAIAAYPRSIFEDGCLLCSESKPDRCHRSLAADYLARRWPGLEIRHL